MTERPGMATHLRRLRAFGSAARARAVSAYRSTGADLPFGDPLPPHATIPLEGYAWRFTDPAAGRVVAVFFGIYRTAGHTRALVTLVASPGGPARSVAVGEGKVFAAPDRFEIRAGDALCYRDGHLRVDLGPGARLDVHLSPTSVWPRNRPLHGGGLASIVPYLVHYWHPHLFDATVTGFAEIQTQRWNLSDSHAFFEKELGKGFPQYWWWGQAHGFSRPDVCVAFAGGRLELGSIGLDVTGVAVRIGRDVLRLVPPVGVVSARITDDHWRLTGVSPRTRITIDADCVGTSAWLLPIPIPASGAIVPSDRHYPTGRLRLCVVRDGKLLFRGVSTLAALELGTAPRHARSAGPVTKYDGNPTAAEPYVPEHQTAGGCVE